MRSDESTVFNGRGVTLNPGMSRTTYRLFPRILCTVLCNAVLSLYFRRVRIVYFWLIHIRLLCIMKVF